MTDEAVIDEVREVLAQASTPLTRQAILDLTEVAESHDIAGALHTLVKQDEVHVQGYTGDGKNLYAAGPAPEDAPEATRQASKSQPSKAPAVKSGQPIRTGITDRVRNAVAHAGGPVTSRQLSEALGEPLTSVSSALTWLAKQGEIEGERMAGSNAKQWRPVAGTVPRIDVERGESSDDPQSLAGAFDAPDRASPQGDELHGPVGYAVYAYRSDGCMDIRKGESLVSLSEDETEDLFHYLKPWVVARHREAL